MARSPQKFDWNGYPLLDAKHADELEMVAAENEFQHKMSRGEAQHRAYREYRNKHHLASAAHHLRGMKAAQGSGDMDSARKHGAIYQLHMGKLGLEPWQEPTPELKAAMHADDRKPVHSFRAHPSDAFVLDDHRKSEVPVEELLHKVWKMASEALVKSGWSDDLPWKPSVTSPLAPAGATKEAVVPHGIYHLNHRNFQVHYTPSGGKPEDLGRHSDVFLALGRARHHDLGIRTATLPIQKAESVGYRVEHKPELASNQNNGIKTEHFAIFQNATQRHAGYVLRHQLPNGQVNLQAVPKIGHEQHAEHFRSLVAGLPGPIVKAESLSKPPVSEAQRRAMHAAASGHSTLGIPKKVGKEFADADRGGKLPAKKAEPVLVSPAPALHSSVEGFLGGLRALPKGTPDRGRFMGSLKKASADAPWFRVTDEQKWQHQFQASNPQELAHGIRQGWVAFINREGAGATQVPQLALKSRLKWVDDWLNERMDRATKTSAQVQSWQGQAVHWRQQARIQYGAGGGLSPLRLHVRSAVKPNNRWLSPGNNPLAPRVSADTSEQVATKHWQDSLEMLDHDKNLNALCGEVGEWVRKPDTPSIVHGGGETTSPRTGHLKVVKAESSSLHSTVDGFMGGLKTLPKGTPDRGRFITAHMSHAPFLSALQSHPQGKQVHAMLTQHLNSVQNAGMRPGAAVATAKNDSFQKMTVIYDNPWKPKTVYRVQNEQGQGPYRGLNLEAESDLRPKTPNQSWTDDFDEDELESMGLGDAGIWTGLGDDSSDTLFGFENKEDAKKWFEHHLPKLARKGYRLVPAQASKVVRSKSGSQVMFTPYEHPDEYRGKPEFRVGQQVKCTHVYHQRDMMEYGTPCTYPGVGVVTGLPNNDPHRHLYTVKWPKEKSGINHEGMELREVPTKAIAKKSEYMDEMLHRLWKKANELLELKKGDVIKFPKERVTPAEDLGQDAKQVGYIRPEGSFAYKPQKQGGGWKPAAKPPTEKLDRAKGVIAEAVRLMSQDPGMQAAVRQRDVQAKKAQLRRGPQKFRKGDRVACSHVLHGQEECGYPWTGTVTGLEPNIDPSEHHYMVEWETQGPGKPTGQGLHAQSELRPH